MKRVALTCSSMVKKNWPDKINYFARYGDFRDSWTISVITLRKMHKHNTCLDQYVANTSRNPKMHTLLGTSCIFQIVIPEVRGKWPKIFFGSVNQSALLEHINRSASTATELNSRRIIGFTIAEQFV